MARCDHVLIDRGGGRDRPLGLEAPPPPRLPNQDLRPLWIPSQTPAATTQPDKCLLHIYPVPRAGVLS